jgi:uncharacterized protein YbaR (Trm112 family)
LPLSSAPTAFLACPACRRRVLLLLLLQLLQGKHITRLLRPLSK